MSSSPQLRRADRQLSEARVVEMLARGYCGRLATIGADGTPYVVPLLYVLLDGQVYVHNTSARGHLRENIDHNARACFEVDEPGDVFAYGRFECDTAISYRSVIAFGTVRIVEDREEKTRFCTALMEKYAPNVSSPASGGASRSARHATRGEAHPPMSLRWQQRPDEVKRIDTYNQQQKSLLLRSPGKPKHDPALRQKFRVDPPDGTTPPGKPAQNAAAGSSNYASLRAPSLTSRGRARSLQGID